MVVITACALRVAGWLQIYRADQEVAPLACAEGRAALGQVPDHERRYRNKGSRSLAPILDHDVADQGAAIVELHRWGQDRLLAVPADDSGIDSLLQRIAGG